MKKQLQFVGVAILCFSSLISRSQIDQVTTSMNYADILVGSSGVINPGYAVDADLTNYAVMRTTIGALNSAILRLGWSQLGTSDDIVTVEFQNDNGVLSLEVLQAMSIYLFDSKGNLIGKRQGFDFSDVTVVQGTSEYKVRLRPKNGSLDIASMRIKISGLASLENRIRVYFASLGTGCVGIHGGSVFAQHNVTNANNAISASQNDYATLNPPLLSGDSYLDLAFTQPAAAGKSVLFQLGEGTTPLSAELLQNITFTAYDTSGNVVASQSGFNLADAVVLGGGRFDLALSTPTGNYQVGRARIEIVGLLNVLTTLKVYDMIGHVFCNKNIAQEPVLSPRAQAITNLQVYPNPFHGYATLDFKNISSTGYYITISDKSGAVMEEYKVSAAGSIKILEKAPVGVYFIKISSDVMSETRKVIKL